VTQPKPRRAGAGQSITRNERLVLARLAATGEPLKAYQLLEQVREDGVNAPMTVYRALDRLIARGLARRVANLNAFVAAQVETGDGVGALLICRRCNRTIERAVDRDRFETLLAAAGFEIDEIHIEAFGACARGTCCSDG
jgi:Fur family zinc uptake transcriptional regulator